MPQSPNTSSGPLSFTDAATIATIRSRIQTGTSITADDITAIVVMVNNFAGHVHQVYDISYVYFGIYGSSTAASYHNTYGPTGFTTYASPVGAGAEITAGSVNQVKNIVNTLVASHDHQVDDY